ncbi:hypothetical protein [uncultured Hymenobacter sp.]|uniref:hypothetical protein n=1 Tax=uncultured Hymenobacter sp. TaxID=170016 RepID=UPI0035C9E929
MTAFQPDYCCLRDASLHFVARCITAFSLLFYPKKSFFILLRTFYLCFFIESLHFLLEIL